MSDFLEQLSNHAAILAEVIEAEGGVSRNDRFLLDDIVADLISIHIGKLSVNEEGGVS